MSMDNLRDLIDPLMTSVQKARVDDLCLSWDGVVTGMCVNDRYLESVTISNELWYIEVEHDGTFATYRREDVGT